MSLLTPCHLVFTQVIKNHFASEFIYNRYKHEKTCGVIETDASGGITKYAEPVGVVAGACLYTLHGAVLHVAVAWAFLCLLCMKQEAAASCMKLSHLA